MNTGRSVAGSGTGSTEPEKEAWNPPEVFNEPSEVKLPEALANCPDPPVIVSSAEKPSAPPLPIEAVPEYVPKIESSGVACEVNVKLPLLKVVKLVSQWFCTSVKAPRRLDTPDPVAFTVISGAQRPARSSAAPPLCFRRT